MNKELYDLLKKCSDETGLPVMKKELFLKIFEWSGAKEVYVPRVGLSDGMIKELCKYN